MMFKNICWVNWLFFAMIAFLAVISVSSLLSGCGNRGELYLPDDSASQSKASTDKKK